MPTLPGYDSKQSVNPIATAPLRNNDPMINEAAAAGQDTQNMLKTLDVVTQKLSDANDVMQFTKAKSTAQIGLAQQEALAKADPNPDNADAHLKAIQNVADKSVDGISNQMVAQKASSEIKADAFVAGIKINSMFKEKQMLANDIALGSYADTAAQNKSNAVTPALGMQVEQDFLKTIQTNYAAGLITEGRAKGLIDDYRIGEVKNDIIKEGATQIGDSSVLTEIQKGKDGKYNALSTDQRTEASRMVRLQVRDNKQISTEQNMSTRIDTIKGIANGEITWQNTKFITDMAQKDPDLAEALQKNLTENKKGGTYSAQEDKNADFESLASDIFKANTKEDINKYLLKALTPGMSMDRLSILVNAAEQRGSTLPTMKDSTNGQVDPKQQQIDSAFKHIQNYVKVNKPKDDNVIINFFKNLGTATPPIEAASRAINAESIKNRPDIIGNPPTGRTMIDKYGNRALVFPDGHVEEIKGNKSK